jgi:hypothetical protein
MFFLMICFTDDVTNNWKLPKDFFFRVTCVVLKNGYLEFQCGNCSATFKDSQQLELHQKSIHPVESGSTDLM